MAVNDFFIRALGASTANKVSVDRYPSISIIDPAVDELWKKTQSPNSASMDNYFDYFFSGQDIIVTVDGTEDDAKFRVIPIIQIGFNITQNKTPIYGFASYCVDKDTEAFTQRGWVNGNDITVDDLILSMDKNGQFKWSIIKEVYRDNNFSGQMHYLTNKNVDALVTPGHNFMSVDGNLIPVEQLQRKDRLRVMGEALEDTAEIYSDAFIELVGWYVTEGHDRKGCNTISIAQSERVNITYLNRIRDCLKELSIARVREDYDDRSGVVHIEISAREPIISEIKHAAPKKILSMEFLLLLSKRQRNLLLDTMLSGDGSGCGRFYDGAEGPKLGRQYGQKLKEAANSITLVCTLLGIPTTLHQESDGEWKVTLKWRKVIEGYGVDFHGGFKKKHRTLVTNPNRKSRAKGGNVPTVPYEGLVWCPQTEYGTFVCRRNGRVYVTGNTYDAVMRGTRIIQGSFTIATRYPNYMKDLLAQAAKSRHDQNGSGTYNYYRGLTEDDANIEKYWQNTLDPAVLRSSVNIFSVHPPFSFVIIYGVQNVSLHPSVGGRGMEEWQSHYDNDTAWMTDVNERLIESDLIDQSNRIVLDACELTSCEIGFGTDGSVCTETYNFFARDVIVP